MAKAKEIEVLNQADYDQIVAALKHLELIEHVIDKAKNSGVDCGEYCKMADNSAAALHVLLKEWFPKGRPK